MTKLLTLLALACTLTLHAPHALAADPLKVRIGVEGAYPPFSSVGPDGKLKGFDIDIANALCTEMKAQCTLVQQDFDGMIPALKARKFDIIVASLSITPERQKVVDFSDKYYSTPARFVARLSAKLDVSGSGLKGKKVGVQRATIHERFAAEQYTGAEIVRYAKQDEVFLDLASGRLDGALADSVAIDQGFLKTPAGKGFGFVGPVYTDEKYFGVGAGIAMRKGDTATRDRLNAAIKAIRGNGVYKQIQDRYFDFDVYGQ